MFIHCIFPEKFVDVSSVKNNEDDDGTQDGNTCTENDGQDRSGHIAGGFGSICGPRFR